MRLSKLLDDNRYVHATLEALEISGADRKGDSGGDVDHYDRRA